MALTVGVDVGGTKIAAGVVDEDGRVLAQERAPSPVDDPAALRAEIAVLVAALQERHEVSAVGLAGAGFVTADRRHVFFAPNIDFGGEPIADLLQERLGIPVVVENDGNAAAWAEFRFGAGRGVADQLMVAVGTGVGGGLVLGGRLYRGGHGVAAEVGHLNLVPHGRPCPCGRDGCWEQYASGSALQRDARDAAEEGRAPRLLEAGGGAVEGVTGHLVTDLARTGEPEALELLDRFGGWLGLGIATLVAVLDPALVVVGGGVGEAGELVLEPTRRGLQRELTGRGRRPAPELRAAALGNDAGMIGAADLARGDR